MIRSTQTAILFAVGAMALSGCALLGASEAPRDETGSIDKKANAYSIRVGDCINDPGEGDVDRVPVVPCSEPHGLEVFHEFGIQTAGFPETQEAMDELTFDQCDPAFRTLAGRSYEESRLNYTSMQPTKSSWFDGDRLVHCMLTDPESPKLTGSLAGANQWPRLRRLRCLPEDSPAPLDPAAHEP
ncbi:hypothetical protein DQ353_09240 [Arthrobacter sp. AQ5-05]|uniref:septum formation family protein n=1 Tax=Arthrobacter sp. AQ5-05 TaxID=2184581 RepID=UPI000DCB482C|nr:septum formation family protein [Arthrobacter sp. AQ5-05]RAX49457.1 hypothetical protein DQ353_09240 [Arthrobacter sp. AQ5-05]